MTERELRDRLTQAIDNSDYKWRTVRGLSRDVKASPTQIERILTNSGAFVRSKAPNGNGESLFSSIERYKKETPILGRLIGAATNTVVG